MSRNKMKMRSTIWTMFTPDDKVPQMAICNICKNRFSFKTSTSNLKRHILSRHPTISMKFAVTDPRHHLAQIQEVQEDHNTTANEDISDERESQNIGLNQEARKDATQRGENQNKRSEKPSAVPASQKKQKISATEEALSVMRDISVHRASATDQYKAFGDQVGLRIRDLPSSNARTMVKHLISNVLFEAEMGKYDSPVGAASFPQAFPSQNYLQQCFEQPSNSGFPSQSVISPTPSVHSLDH